MLKGLGDIGQILKMQRELKSAQKRIKNTKLTVESPDKEVQLVISGEYYISKFELDEEFVEKSSVNQIEKKVVDTVNSAIKQVQAFSAEQMKDIAGGMDIPGLGNFLK